MLEGLYIAAALIVLFMAVNMTRALVSFAPADCKKTPAKHSAKRESAAEPVQPDAPKRKRGRPRKNPAPAPALAPVVAPVAVPAPVPAAAPAPRPAAIRGNNAFAGQCVAFSGTIPGMKRAEAIQAVIDNGGQAFEDMPACTTLLVVGDKPGAGKLEKASKWGARMISALDFSIMLEQPLTLTPDEFAALYAA